jgi:hypothetical protein
VTYVVESGCGPSELLAISVARTEAAALKK